MTRRIACACSSSATRCCNRAKGNSTLTTSSHAPRSVDLFVLVLTLLYARKLAARILSAELDCFVTVDRAREGSVATRCVLQLSTFTQVKQPNKCVSTLTFANRSEYKEDLEQSGFKVVKASNCLCDAHRCPCLQMEDLTPSWTQFTKASSRLAAIHKL